MSSTHVLAIDGLVRPPTLVRAVADALRERIFRGDLAAGAPLREVHLSRALQVSRGTVREAARQLRDEGLVEVLPHRGVFVARLTADTAREIYTLRALLEPYAVRLAVEAQAFDPPALEALDALVGRWARLEREGQTSEILRAEIEFHHAICRGSRHRLLLAMLEHLVTQTQLLVLHTKLYQSDQTPDDVSHRAILTAIRAGDPAAAEATVRRHILEAGELLVRRLVARDAAPAPDAVPG
jgi:DNA-binding GntR family transcriptional regulator